MILENSMSQYITLGLNIALLVFVGFGVLFGFIKGLRKSASNGIFLIILSIILLFVTVPITNALLNIKFNSNITIGEETLVGLYSIKDIVQFFVKQFLGASFAESNPEFVSVITTLPLVFVYTIVYVLLFWVCRLLLLPLNYLFYRLTFAPKKKKENFGFSAFNNENDETSEIQNEPTENNLENINSETSIQQDEENTFGKEGTFIKTEIEEPKIEHVVPVDFNSPKKEKKKKEKIKVKKHRLWGALIGGVTGLFVMLNTLLPVYGLKNILQDVNEVNLTNISEENISLSSQTNGVTDDVMKGYDESIFNVVSKFSGVEGLALAEFDFLTSKNINDNKVVLRKDIESLIATIKEADAFVGKYKAYLGSGNWSSLTQEQISGIIKDTKDLLAVARSVKLVDCVADYLIPIASNYLVNSGTQISDNAIVNELATDALNALARSEDINVFDEVTSLLDLVEYINNQGLLTKVLQNDFSDPIATINSLDADFGKQFISKLYNLKTFSLTMPYMLNIGLNYLEQAINYGYEKIVYENIENIKTAFSNIVDNVIIVAKSIDTSSSIYITNESLVPLGKLLQTIKVSGIVNDTTYQNLINFAVDELQKLLQGFVPAELEDYLINEFVENIAKVDNWDFEMTTISNAIRKLRDVQNGILGEVVEGEELRSGLDIEIIMKPGVFRNLGESLDMLEGTVLFGAKTYKNEHPVSGTISLFLSLLDYADTSIKTSITDTSLQKVTDVFDKIKTNLIESNHTYNSENKFWANELDSVAPLIIEVYDMINSGNFDITTELGKSLDQAKSSTLFGNGATLDLMKVSLDIVSDSILGDTYTYNDGSDISNPQVLNDKIYELFVAVKDNLSLASTLEQVRTDSQFWQNEFEYYQSLKNIAENSSKLSSVSDAKTLATDLDKISGSYTIPQNEIFDIVAFAIKDIKYKDTTDTIELSINDLIDKIANRLESDTYFDGKDLTDFWAIEFDHLSNIMNIKFSDDGEYKLINNLGNIGVELDKVVLGYEVLDNALTTDINESKTVRASYILTADDLRVVLGTAMDTMVSTITSSFSSDIQTSVQTALTDIQTNILDTTNIKDISFEKEMNHLQTLANLKVDSSMLSYPTGTDSEISAKLLENQQKLNDLGEQLDSIAYEYKLDGDIYEYTDIIDVEKGLKNSTNSKLITRSILTNLIKNIFNIAKVTIEASDDSNTQEEKDAFNTMIANIQTEMGSIATADKVMSWQRELGYVNNLVKMNSGVSYDISNVATEVGKNLDAIAFNTINVEVSGVATTIFNDILYDSNNNCIYIPAESLETSGNSLFITRSALKTMMSSYLSRLKEDEATGDDIEKEQKGIVNSIIDNSIATIAGDDSELQSENYYKNFNTCFSAMTTIKNDIDTKLNSVSGGYSTFDAETAQAIDEFLNDYQEKPITGILITRRMAVLVLNKIGLPTGIEETLLAQVTTYYNNLKTYYTDKNTAKNNTDKENYVADNSITDEYKNPFVTLYNKVNPTT